MSNKLSKTSKASADAVSNRTPLTPPTAEKDDLPTMTLPSVAAVARDGKGQDKPTDNPPTMTLPSVVAMARDGSDSEESQAIDDNPLTLLSMPAVMGAALEDEDEDEDEHEHEHEHEKARGLNQPASNDEHQPPPHTSPAPPSVPVSRPPATGQSGCRPLFGQLVMIVINLGLATGLVLTILFQMNGTLFYESRTPVRRMQGQVTELERQANALEGKVEVLQQRVAQFETLQEQFEAVTTQIETLGEEQTALESELKEAEGAILGLQGETSQLQEQLSTVQQEVSVFDGFLVSLRSLLIDTKPLPTFTPTATGTPTVRATRTPQATLRASRTPQATLRASRTPQATATAVQEPTSSAEVTVTRTPRGTATPTP